MRLFRRWFISLFLISALLSLFCAQSVAQVPEVMEEASPVPSPSATSVAEPSGDGLYFSDVMVRGRPIFQVGSLPSLSAEQRAELINRRIASILSRGDPSAPVTVQLDEARNLATLRLNRRVLMTITQQDAEDFGLSVQELAEEWRDRLNTALQRPPLAIDVAQRLNSTLRELARDAIDGLPAFIGAVLVILATWLVAVGVRYAMVRWAKQTEGDRSTEVLIARLGYGGIWVIGSIIALGLMGLNFGAMLGALGLTSVAIGFSLKDVLSNYISGVILLAARPFRLNDQVVINDYEGTIVQIQLRATTIRTYDGRMVYIPNQQVFQSSITNNTASPRRRSSLMVGIDYDADINRAVQTIYSAIENLHMIEESPPPEVLVRELAASTVNLEVRFWVDSRRAGFLEMSSKVTQAIKEALQQAKIEMPTEIYTLVFRNSLNDQGAIRVNVEG